MTDSSITSLLSPPPELVQQWWTEFERTEPDTDSLVFIATQAARWGADQELEACCEWLDRRLFDREEIRALRAARRPKAPSLKEQALIELGDVYNRDKIDDVTYDTIRRALEALPE